MAEELRRKMGGQAPTTNTRKKFDVDDIEVEETPKKSTKKSGKKAADDGGLGSIFGNMGIDMGNLGGLAESILKTIGLAGKSI